MDGEEQNELRQVMWEVTQALDGQASALTLHSDGAASPQVLFCESRSGGLSAPHVVGAVARLGTKIRSEHQWIEAPAQGFSHALSIPVQRVPGFSRLMLSVFFDDLSTSQRRQAEAAYLQRRPFAIGYFRLWQLNRRQSRQIEALEAAVDVIEPGVILLDGLGKRLHANKGAEALLAAGDGICLNNGAIVATQRREALILRAAIDHVILAHAKNRNFQHAPIFSLTRQAGPSLLISVISPPRVPADPSDVAAIVYLLDPAINTEQLFGQLRQLYELTPVEARLACLIVEGRALTDAAAAMRVKEQSARSCLKQVFAKTQTHRQADLVRLVLSNFIRTSSQIPR